MSRRWIKVQEPIAMKKSKFTEEQLEQVPVDGKQDR
jgi:hypothetical protein